MILPYEKWIEGHVGINDMREELRASMIARHGTNLPTVVFHCCWGVERHSAQGRKMSTILDEITGGRWWDCGINVNEQQWFRVLGFDDDRLMMHAYLIFGYTNGNVPGWE